MITCDEYAAVKRFVADISDIDGDDTDHSVDSLRKSWALDAATANIGA